MKQIKMSYLKIGLTLLYLLMILVNALAGILPINGRTTQEISETYDTLFAPSGSTFAIWGVIYLFLGLFTIALWFKSSNSSVRANQNIVTKVSLLAGASFILNTIWIFCWQYLQFGLSVIIIISLLVVLILLNRFLLGRSYSLSDYFFIRFPFSIYFGWITVASIANISTYIVSKDIPFFTSSQQGWTILILIVGATIGSLTVVNNRDLAYGFVFLWAYFGILRKHQMASGWNNQYPMVIYTVIACLVILAFVCLYVWNKNRYLKKAGD